MGTAIPPGFLCPTCASSATGYLVPLRCCRLRNSANMGARRLGTERKRVLDMVSGTAARRPLLLYAFYQSQGVYKTYCMTADPQYDAVSPHSWTPMASCPSTQAGQYFCTKSNGPCNHGVSMLSSLSKTWSPFWYVKKSGTSGWTLLSFAAHSSVCCHGRTSSSFEW